MNLITTIINFSDTVVKAVNLGLVMQQQDSGRVVGYIIEMFLDNSYENMWPQLKYENRGTVLSTSCVLAF